MFNFRYLILASCALFVWSILKLNDLFRYSFDCDKSHAFNLAREAYGIWIGSCGDFVASKFIEIIFWLILIFYYFTALIVALLFLIALCSIAILVAIHLHDGLKKVKEIRLIN
jgi:hypothetical protein